MNGKPNSRVTLAFMGDGALNQGSVHEAMNLASVLDLPVIFIVENNFYAMGTAIERCTAAGGHIADRAKAYDMDAATLEGMDVLDVYRGMKPLIDRCRETSRPCFVDMRCYRFKGHSAVGLTVHHLIAVLGGEGKACPKRNLGTHNAVAPVHVMLRIKEVHRATLAFGAPSDSAKEFSHCHVRSEPASERMPVIAIRSNDWIVWLQCGHASHSNRLLPVVDVHKASCELVLIGLHRADLELADQHHVT
jgi:transketolase